MKHLLASIQLILVLVSASLIAPPAAAGADLLANPGFEALGGSYDGWFTFGNNVVISADTVRTGAAASKIFGDFGGCPGPPSPGLRVNGYGQAFTPTAGLVYRFSGYSYISSQDPIPGSDPCSGVENLAVAKVVFFDSAVGGNEIASNELTIGDSQSPTDEWTLFSVEIPAPAGALRVEALILYLQRECDPGAVFVDDTSFLEFSPPPETNVLVNPSYTAGLTGWNKFGNVFPESQSALVLSPTGSGKMFSTFTVDSPSGMFQRFPAPAGSAWTLDVYGLTNCADGIIGTDNYVVARIVFRDATGAEIDTASVERVVLDGNSPVNSWRKTTVSAYTPAGADSVEALLLFISPVLDGGAAWLDNVSFRQLSTTGVPAESRLLPFQLHQNMPNPFSPSTRIDFDLARDGRVDISVYDVAGRRVATLFTGELGVGPHYVTWDGRTANGTRAAAGVYRYVLTTPMGRTSRSMVLIR